MEIQAIQKYIHTAPRKLRLVADMIRKLSPEKALETLRFTNKSAAGDLIKAIKTVVANAKTKGMENINFKSVEVNEGSRMKRFRAGAKGRARPYKRRMSHIKIVLTDDLSDKVQVTRNNKEDKKEKK